MTNEIYKKYNNEKLSDINNSNTQQGKEIFLTQNIKMEEKNKSQ